jgi:lipoprotein NlpI
MSRARLSIGCLIAMLCAALSLDVIADEEPAKLLEQASRAAAQGDSDKAVTLATQAIEQDPTLSAAYYLRGREHFRLGKVRESVADFDKYVQLRPEQHSRQWERGIACYYAQQFDKGAKQFELYQTFHNNDVENSVWRYLCVARTEGVDKARSTLLPIENDRRVPMMQIYDLYRGKLEPADVLAAANAGNPPADTLSSRLFYAHLYLGLYYEAAGNAALAKKHILEAADNHKHDTQINGYMWDVARVHADLLRGKDLP